MGKSSQDKHIGDLGDSETILVDEVPVELPPDFHQLSEANHDDPQIKQWCEEGDKRFIEKFGKISHEELFKIEKSAYQIIKENTKLGFREAVNIAMRRISFRKKRCAIKRGDR